LKTLKAAVKYLLFLAVGLILLWLAFRNENIGDVLYRMRVADPFWLTLSILIALVALVSRAIRWKILIEPLGHSPRTTNTFYALLVGYLANLAIPRIGEITRCASLNKSEKVPFSGLVGTVIVERAIDVIMLLVCMFIVAIFEFQTLFTFLEQNLLLPISIKLGDNFALLMFSAGLIVMMLLSGAIWFLRNKESRLRIRVSKLLREIIAGLGTVLIMEKKGWFVFHTILIWFCYFLITYVCFFCLDATSHLDASTGLFITVVGGFGMSAPVQGGIGAFHYVVSQALQIFGISSTDGIVFATLLHTSQTLLIMVLGAWAFFMLMRNERINNR
jgi:uncharacterized protein (TIRG00374 family)